MASSSNVSDELLDAAREAILAVGVRRATLTEVARRAGVSRMTLYRHAPDRATLLLALVTREFTDLLARAYQEIDTAGDARSRLAALASRVVCRLPDEPLFRRVVELDPELLLPYLTGRTGATQRAAERIVAALIEAGVRDGSVVCADPSLRARALVVALTAFTLSKPMRGPGLAGEVASLVDRWLAPQAGCPG